MAEREHRDRLERERAAAAAASKLALIEAAGRVAAQAKAAKEAAPVAEAPTPPAPPKDDGAPEETVRARLARQVLVTLDATMAELGSADPKDRASILSLAAKVSGMLATDTEGETRPFTLRGFAPCEPEPVAPVPGEGGPPAT